MHYLSAALILCLGWQPAQAQFGQNQVVIKDFKWTVQSTEHFDIHYYEGSAAWAPKAAEILERSYQNISKRLDHGFTERRPFFLYANVNDMEQSSIVQVGDGTGGVTEAFKDRFIVYNDGTKQWLDDVITHELTHVFQYSVLISGFWKSARILKAFVYPLWMMEGMAEYSTGGLDDTTEEIYVRDAATSNGLIPLWKLEHFSHLKPHQVTLAYKSGETAIAFLGSQYGSDKVGKMLKLFESHFESSSVLQELIGLDIFAFDKKWREFMEDKYRRVVRLQRLSEPAVFGVQLTANDKNKIPVFNSSPVFTPDGRRMAFISTLGGHPPAVVIQDLVKGKVKYLVFDRFTQVDNIMQGNFTNISRVLAISPDGKMLAFSSQKNHADYLSFYDLDRKKMTRVKFPEIMQIMEPSFSPDGAKVAFSGMKEGLTDIYLYDLKTKRLTQLTNDPEDDQSPVFSPDGKSIVFSSEVEIPGDEMRYQRRLYRLNLADQSLQKLEDIHGSARDPYISPDQKRLLFALEADGFMDIHEMELDSGRITRLTRTKGGSFTPIYTPQGDIAFSSFRYGCIQIYRGGRERFLTDIVSNGLSRTQQGSAMKRGRGSDNVTLIPAARAENRSTVIVSSNPVLSLPGMEGAPVATATATWATGGPAVSTAATLSPPRPYKFSASTDLFLPAFFYSSQGGLFWTSYWQGSDMLGNHQATGLVSYNSGAGYLNYQAQYQYARYRPQLIAGAQGVAERSLIDFSTGFETNQSIYQEFAGVLYPLDRFHRLELVGSAVTQSIYYPNGDSANIYNDARIVNAAFVRDTVTGRYLIADRGSRLRLAFIKAAPVLGGNINFHSATGEGAKYFDMGNQSTLVFHSLAASSWGADGQQFILGGIGGVRGYARSTSENAGNRAVLGTAEYRFPIVKNLDYYMWYFFPDFYFKAIYGAVFSDAGFAWSTANDIQSARVDSIRNSYGVGVRIHTFILQLFPLVVQFDYAERTTSKGGVFYVYLGPVF